MICTSLRIAKNTDAFKAKENEGSFLFFEYQAENVYVSSCWVGTRYKCILKEWLLKLAKRRSKLESPENFHLTTAQWKILYANLSTNHSKALQSNCRAVM